ncbi:MAG: asparagine synthase (glutamine-hydrolyzing) [Phycisphaerae bacterium]
MCGIAGFVAWSWGKRSQSELSRFDALLADAARRADKWLRHRGPDGSGQWNQSGGGTPATRVCLLHRRLSIIDPAGGQQPMGNEDGRVQVVFNGEIYNHRELRRELESLGHVFRSDHCDTEVLVHGWEQWETELPSKLRGMFAFAIWDGNSSELFLARDYFGQKPLFYAAGENQFVFASTIPAVRCWPGVAATVSRSTLARYLHSGYVSPPETVYREIKSLAPGSYLRVTGGRLSTGSYWNPELSAMNAGGAAAVMGDEEIATLRQLILSAVESQLHADVPMIGFLSGGIDSAIICGAAKTLLGDSCSLQAITVGFEDTAFDEMALAGETARLLGLRHHPCRIDMESSAMATLEWLTAFTLGQPFADSSILPTYWVANSARQLAPCALSGDGGDEIFGGYDRYRAMRMLHGGLRIPAWPYKSERLRRLSAAGREKHRQAQYAAITALFSLESLAPLGGTGDITRHEAQRDFDVIRACMLSDQGNYLPGDVLWKVDCASMACGLEVRSPLLDHELANWANRFNGNVMMNWRRGKLPLRRAMADMLPKGVLRGRKHGFGVPIGRWFRTSLRHAAAGYLLAGDSFTAELGLGMLAERMWEEHQAGRRDHTHRLFALLMMEIWRRQSPDIACEAS